MCNVIQQIFEYYWRRCNNCIIYFIFCVNFAFYLCTERLQRFMTPLIDASRLLTTSLEVFRDGRCMNLFFIIQDFFFFKVSPVVVLILSFLWCVR